MENYADYEFYTNTYKGSLSSNLFSSLIVKASREIDRNVNIKLTQDYISSLSSGDQYKIKYVACELCDFIEANGSNGVGGKAKSISIDGVSKTNTNANYNVNDLANIKRNIIDNLPQEIIRYL